MLGYHEEKPRQLRRIAWRIINTTLFRLSGGTAGWPIRKLLLRWFGARLGHHCYIYSRCRIFAPWNLVVGSEVCIGPSTNLYNKGRLKVGARTVISQEVSIITASHDTSSLLLPLIVKEVAIGEDCWIAAGATICPGITVGDGAVVSARAVVFDDVEPYTIVRGNPAEILRSRKIKK